MKISKILFGKPSIRESFFHAKRIHLAIRESKSLKFRVFFSRESFSPRKFLPVFILLFISFHGNLQERINLAIRESKSLKFRVFFSSRNFLPAKVSPRKVFVFSFVFVFPFELNKTIEIFS